MLYQRNGLNFINKKSKKYFISLLLLMCKNHTKRIIDFIIAVIGTVGALSILLPVGIFLTFATEVHHFFSKTPRKKTAKYLPLSSLKP